MSARPLTHRINEMVASGDIALPVYPPVARQILALLRQRSPDTSTLVETIGQEPALTCGLFRAANSAFYQGLPKVLTIDEAMTRLGAARAARLLEEQCREGGGACRGRWVSRYLAPLWRHSLGCALGAGWLARRCGYHVLAGQVHLAGLLHDIGKLFLLTILEQLAGSDGEGVLLSDTLVEEVLASMHAGTGGQLALAWNLPDTFAAVIGRHHDPDPSGQEVVAALVRLANLGCRKLGLGWASDPGLVLPTTAEAQFLGIDEIALAECEIMLEDRFALVPDEGAVGKP